MHSYAGDLRIDIVVDGLFYFIFTIIHTIDEGMKYLKTVIPPETIN